MPIHAEPPATARLLPGLLVWAVTWLGLLLLDGRLDLATMSLLLVAGSALATPWLPVGWSLLVSAASVLGFNWAFVPPRGSFTVDGIEHVWLLVGMAVVTWVVAALSAALRRQLAEARRWARRAEQLRQWGEATRDCDEPVTEAAQLQQMLSDLAGGPVALWVLRGAGLHPGEPSPTDAADTRLFALGATDAEETAGLAHCLRQREAMGPGTGRHQHLAQWYLPLRGRAAVLGAALLRGEAVRRIDDDARRHAQALCDQLGQALERRQSREAEDLARAEARTQQARNALLAAVSHDYRTPLATILGAADSLIDQGAQRSAEQRRALAQTIRDQATQLARLTDNTLQLARLDAPGVTLRLDWESPEEIVGAALHRARQREAEGQWRARGSTTRLHARTEPGLPLLRCDAVLLAQLLDNLVDNALAYAPGDSPIELLARRQGEQLLLAVRDRGPGLPPAEREQVFEVYRRGPESARAARGAGVGLAVCRAIAEAHGGSMKLRRRGHGGSAFECLLPLHEAPVGPDPEPLVLPDEGPAGRG